MTIPTRPPAHSWRAVLGTSRSLKAMMDRHKPDQVPDRDSASRTALLRRIVRSLQSYKVPIRTLPNLRELIDRKIEIGQIRDLAIEDLLRPRAGGLDPALLSCLLSASAFS